MLAPLGDKAGDHRRRGQRQRSAEKKGRQRRKAEQQAKEAEAEGAEGDLHRAEAKYVARLVVNVLQREMQADFEQEEDDSELRQKGDRRIRLEEIEAAGAQDDAERQIADDRAQPRRPAGDGCDDAEQQQQYDRLQRVENGVGVAHADRPRRASR